MKRSRAQANLQYGDRSGNVKKRRIYQPRARPQITRVNELIRQRNMLEKKGMDTALIPTAGLLSPFVSTTNTNADILPVNLVQIGNGSWNRVGKSITMTSLRIQGAVFATCTSPAAALEPASLRMTVVYDSQPSGNAVPTFDTIFGRTSQAGTESTELYDPLRYDNVGRFKVLRDKVIDLNPQAYDSADTSTYVVQSIDEFIKLPQLVTIYSGQSSPMTIADISSGGLYVIFRSIPVLSVSVTPNRLNARLRYYD